MRHKAAVEVDLGERGKGWHYADLGERGGGPIGFCADHPPHATEEEARLCYSSYLRQNLKVEQYGNWEGCQFVKEDGSVCDKPTKSGWGVGFALISVALCDTHCTRGEALPLLGLDKPWGDSFGSI